MPAAPAAAFSVQLARFPTLRVSQDPIAGGLTDVRFLGIGADSRAAGTEPGSREAFTFLLFGLHDTVAGAEACLAARRTLVPWWDEATEVWGAALLPTRHVGATNHLSPSDPGPNFPPREAEASDDGPLVSVTSVGWLPNPDMTRVMAFAQGVIAVRMSMGGTPGLHSAQSFFFPGVIATDPVTVTLWRDARALRTFAYDGGPHRHQMDRHRALETWDRTSFTRGRIVAHVGTWCGTAVTEWSAGAPA